MSTTYGNKRLVVGAHYGWRDFLVQRISGALMGAFTLIVLLQVLFTQGPIGYDTWHEQHLAGLREGRRHAPGDAGVHRHLAGELRWLGHPGAVASVSASSRTR